MSAAPDRAEVLFGIGSNLGEPLEYLRAAVRELRKRFEVIAVSSVYRTDPVGTEDPRPFLNAAVSARSDLAPTEIIRAILEIEDGLGRVRAARNAPRTIDIDLLGVGDLVLSSGELTLPHPRLHERAFVLVPLADVAPRWVHPIELRTAMELRTSVGSQGVERIGGPAMIALEPG